MDRSDRLIGLLYLVNVFGPVSNSVLESKFVAFEKSLGRPPSGSPGYKALVETLRRRGLIVQTKGRYSVTGEGLNQVALAGLSRTRDNNRLFILKNLL